MKKNTVIILVIIIVVVVVLAALSIFSFMAPGPLVPIVDQTEQTNVGKNQDTVEFEVKDSEEPIELGDTQKQISWDTPEVCDGFDNDRDGEYDEGFDQDKDGIASCFDNCPYDYNPGQEDEDNNGWGDVCDHFPPEPSKEERISKGQHVYVYLDNYTLSQRTKDCIGVENCVNNGNDLLNVLATDSGTREKLVLEKYSESYLLKLKNTVKNYTNKELNSDLYAVKLCSLDNDIDIVAGYLLPEGKSPFKPESKLPGKVSEFYEKPTLLVVNDSSISVAYTGPYTEFRLCNNTATGAEVNPCSASLEDEKIKWSCFKGLYERGKGSYMKYWQFDLGNSTPEIWEDIKYY